MKQATYNEHNKPIPCYCLSCQEHRNIKLVAQKQSEIDSMCAHAKKLETDVAVLQHLLHEINFHMVSNDTISPELAQRIKDRLDTAWIVVPCMFCSTDCLASADLGVGTCVPCHEQAAQIADDPTGELL